MPPRLSVTRQALRAKTEPYVCPQCALHIRKPQNASLRGFTNKSQQQQPARKRYIASQSEQLSLPIRLCLTSRRYASNGALASSTAINAPSTVPPEYRSLYQQLLLLQDEASSYIDLSRLQLAARSLESSSPVVRIALLGLGANGALAARKLARVLLSDALGDEEAWEQELLVSGKDGRSLLLRYGDSEDVVQPSPQVQTIHIPSPFLRRHNVELLVTTVNTNGGGADATGDAVIEQAILVPPLTIPNAGGRVGFVRYPVHKSVVVAEGIVGAVEYGRLPRFLDQTDLIHSALSLPLRSATGAASAEQAATDNVIDIDLATHALKLFRTDKANGAQFSEEWQRSLLPSISKWIAGPAQLEDAGINPAVRNLLDFILSTTSTAVERSEIEQTAAAFNATIPEVKRNSLSKQISDWSQDAHRDLQANLNTALASRTWRRTAWWRLLWRIDDVSVSASDILRLSWLTEAEQSLAFLSGRIAEAGLATLEELKEADASQRVVGAGIEALMETWEPKRAQIMTPADLLQTPTLLSRVQQESGVNALFDPPWPQTIHFGRQQMLHTLVPNMHRKAQALLLTTLSTIGGSSALGAWIMIAFTDLYAAGAVTTLGLVWSLRRLQKLWNKERETCTTALQESGRNVLAEVESHLRRIVKEGGRVTVRVEDQQGWQQARTAIERCREALEKTK